jgi:hypothetical protein
MRFFQLIPLRPFRCFKMSTTTQPPEHSVIKYLAVHKRLGDLQVDPWVTDPADLGGIPMAIKTKLSRALDTMSCIPFAQFGLYLHDKYKSAFTIGDAPAWQPIPTRR